MTIYDDLCDFCGGYVDPIGGDLARVLKDNKSLWCGVCDPDKKGTLAVEDSESAMNIRYYSMADGFWGLGFTVKGKLFTLTIAKWIITNWPE